MAQSEGTTKSQKAKPKRASAKKAPGKKAKGQAKSKSAGARKSAKRAGSKARNGASASGNGGGAAAKGSSNGSEAGSTVGAVVEKAKLPLMATGAVVAGAAAVIATKGVGNHKQHKVLGVPVPKRSKSHLPKVSVPKVGLPKGKGLKGDVRRAAGAVTDAAGKADQIGKRISKVASSVQAVGEATDDAAKKS
jgi:hypothetical protein